MLRRTILKAAPLALIPKVALGRQLSVSGGISGGSPPQSGGGLFTNFTITSTFRFNSQYPTKYTSGDGISPTWADDGNTYIIMNDNQGGFQNGSPPPSVGRIAVGKVDGYTTSLSGANVFDFSTALPSTWYLGGIICVGGVLYMTLSNNTGSFNENQMVMSTNHGASWTPAAPYSSTLWNGSYPYGFVQYGQNYTGNGPHNSNLYVYLYFVAPFTPANSVAAALGRVLISRISALTLSDWSWYQGGDGMNSANWGAYSTAATVFTETVANPNPFYFITGHACWLPHFGCYIFTQSHYVGGSSANGFINYYASLTPWGTYTLVASLDMSSAGSLYQAGAAPASVAVDGGQHITLFASGDYGQAGVPNGPYGLNLIFATLS